MFDSNFTSNTTTVADDNGSILRFDKHTDQQIDMKDPDDYADL